MYQVELTLVEINDIRNCLRARVIRGLDNPKATQADIDYCNRLNEIADKLDSEVPPHGC